LNVRKPAQNENQTNGKRSAPGIDHAPSSYENLPPTAQRLLEAAWRLLKRNGYDGLTLEAIGREAGENKSLIRYYFGGKPGLLVALVDWLLYDQMRDQQQLLAGLPAGAERRQAVIEDGRRIATDLEAYRLFFGLLPHLIEDRETRARMASLYTEYRSIVATCLSHHATDKSSDARTLAAMTVGIVDGLGLQLLLDPGSVDMQRFLELWNGYVAFVLDGNGVQVEGAE
jgi:AcrR family transcriptional regulator